MSSKNISFDSSNQNSSDGIPTNDGIVEVYEENFITEIKRMSALLETYNYIGMDTEFPGVVYSLQNYTNDFYYQSIKLNVNSLNLIQVGITLCNSKGELPKGDHTWQFNLKFNYNKDKFSTKSISLLNECGIDFEKIKRKGIPYDLFAEYFITSGLVLNEDLVWICFHGSYDFAYLLKIATNSPLPENERLFMDNLSVYFPNIYDIKVLTKGIDQLQGGLNRLAQFLEVYRQGMIHQAGSDSILTIKVFFRLIDNAYVEKDYLSQDKNIIFGIGLGSDEEETLSYTKFGNIRNYEIVNNVGNYFPYPLIVSNLS